MNQESLQANSTAAKERPTQKPRKPVATAVRAASMVTMPSGRKRRIGAQAIPPTSAPRGPAKRPMNLSRADLLPKPGPIPTPRQTTIHANPWAQMVRKKPSPRFGSSNGSFASSRRTMAGRSMNSH